MIETMDLISFIFACLLFFIGLFLMGRILKDIRNREKRYQLLAKALNVKASEICVVAQDNIPSKTKGEAWLYRIEDQLRYVEFDKDNQIKINAIVSASLSKNEVSLLSTIEKN